VVTQANTGIVGALNKGFSLARGEFIARMDADDVSLPPRLERQVKFLQDHPEHVAVGSQIMTMDREGASIAAKFLLTTHEQIDAANISGHCAVAHPAMMIRRAALPAGDAYRASFAEDLDLWLRLAERGKLANVPKVLLRYRLHEGSLTLKKGYRQRDILNEMLADARARRGLPAAPPPGTVEGGNYDPRDDRGSYARTALRAGNYLNAMRLAGKALTRQPARPRSWMTVMLALSGPLGRAVLRRTHG
jgi:glycosyltransferase involved in cell wall biosynthesis